jgi:capsular polysaccharide biosynthesis protein
MAFSVGTAFTTEYFDPTIRTPDEAHGLLEVPVLAWLPAPERAVLHFTSRSGRRDAVGQ